MFSLYFNNFFMLNFWRKRFPEVWHLVSTSQMRSTVPMIKHSSRCVVYLRIQYRGVVLSAWRSVGAIHSRDWKLYGHLAAWYIFFDSVMFAEHRSIVLVLSCWSLSSPQIDVLYRQSRGIVHILWFGNLRRASVYRNSTGPLIALLSADWRAV